MKRIIIENVDLLTKKEEEVLISCLNKQNIEFRVEYNVEV